MVDGVINRIVVSVLCALTLHIFFYLFSLIIVTNLRSSFEQEGESRNSVTQHSRATDAVVDLTKVTVPSSCSLNESKHYRVLNATVQASEMLSTGAESLMIEHPLWHWTEVADGFLYLDRNLTVQPRNISITTRNNDVAHYRTNALTYGAGLERSFGKAELVVFYMNTVAK